MEFLLIAFYGLLNISVFVTASNEVVKDFRFRSKNPGIAGGGSIATYTDVSMNHKPFHPEWARQRMAGSGGPTSYFDHHSLKKESQKQHHQQNKKSQHHQARFKNVPAKSLPKHTYSTTNDYNIYASPGRSVSTMPGTGKGLHMSSNFALPGMGLTSLRFKSLGTKLRTKLKK